ncbi:hypothetical protein PPL_11039 [Heterostelium album PN500]|uniref:Uncharacterized protein n=1 Tax=Heterostelium pallidum (strain ATCC 26659 / Pp 5 / PN500) TaxID=670386 RepID=D3BSR9_HETP5|nr:hypothetical protein PPL_11039 [Heterostelium album PN500]EFA75534.1 hypothetical protein PPL_11039 [Heterostelium album PN500]|eukprot:XP_020427668.1 hypothetical protein PPL_11039 [Heterostelium album PN500]
MSFSILMTSEMSSTVLYLCSVLSLFLFSFSLVLKLLKIRIVFKPITSDAIQ